MSTQEKTIDTLIQDIYTYLEQDERGGLSHFNIDELAAEIATMLKNRLEERRRDTFTLRVSNYGLPPRRLWFDSHRPRYKHKGPTLLKFLIGDIYEAAILFLAKAAGHKVEDEQKTVSVHGIEGHLDASIDGVLVDVKSASKWAYKQKFEGKGLLSGDDSFAYIPQLLGYEEAVKKGRCGFLAANKETGELTFLEVPKEKKLEVDVATVAKNAKAALAAELPPEEKCFAPESDGVFGNQILNKACQFCSHKMECWKDANNGAGLRVFNYSKGPVFFTDIKKVPKVEEVTHLWNGATEDEDAEV